MMKNFCLADCTGRLGTSVWLLAISIVVGLVLFQPAMAEDEGATKPTKLMQMSIDDLLSVKVYSASKFTQKITEAPSAVTVITAADIKSYGYRTLADILASVRGLFVSYDRSYQYLGVRGFNRPGDYNSRVLLLVDGYRVNDANYDTASIGQEFFLDVDLIDRIEVVRGPGSSIYGSNAFFGVVNVLTKRGRGFNGTEVSGEVASHETEKGRLTYGKQYENGAELLLSAMSSNSRGQNLYFPEFDTPATNNGGAQNLDRDKANRVYGKFAYGGYSLTAAYSERVKKIPTAAFGVAFNDPNTQSKDSQAVLSLDYSGQLNGYQDISASVFYGGYFYQAILPYNPPPVTINLDEGQSEWWGASAKLESRLEKHKLVTGVEYQDNYRQDLKNYDVAPYVLYTEVNRNSHRSALYAQDEIGIAENLLLNVGLRYDQYSTVGGTTNPRLGFIYNPQPATALKLLYGTAFRAPNNYEMFSASALAKINPDLKPEKITTYELVAEHEVQQNFRLTGSIYRNNISDLINQVLDPTDGLLVFQNIGRVKSQGVELEAERAWANEHRIRASYAWQITRNQLTNAELENSPHHLAKLNYSVPLSGEALRAGAELQFTGSRKTLAGNTTGGFVTANLTLLSQELAQGADISATVYNLFDRRYADPARPEHAQDAIQQDGRSFRLKLDYRF